MTNQITNIFQSTPYATNAVQLEMEQRNNLGYGLGVALGKLLGTREITRKGSFLKDYKKIFLEKTLNVLYVELDPGVDDGAALLQLLTAAEKVNIVGVIPSVGNAVLSQTEKNTLQLLELAKKQEIKVYPGAVAPLAIENDPAAIAQMNQEINATHFYGHDGEADVGNWPKVNMHMETMPGYKFAAMSIARAKEPLTLVSTSALTELSKTLTELITQDPKGSFSSNINAISIMGGCIELKGCNAPFNLPDNEKFSEANFYFDTPAAQNVFSICQKFQIPIILSPLDLTQQPGLLWTKEQVETLKNINNDVAQQMARVTEVVPYLDAPCFPNKTYPMHDLFATASLLKPEFFNVTRMAIFIGDQGRIIANTEAPESLKNVYVLSMPVENQAKFYNSILSEYENFNEKTGLSAGTIALIASIASVTILAAGGGIYIHRHKSKTPTESTNLLPL